MHALWLKWLSNITIVDGSIPLISAICVAALVHRGYMLYWGAGFITNAELRGLNFERDVKTVCTDILDELEIGHEKVFQRYREAMDDVKQGCISIWEKATVVEKFGGMSQQSGGQADHVLLHLGRGLEAAKTVAKGAEAMVQTGCLWRRRAERIYVKSIQFEMAYQALSTAVAQASTLFDSLQEREVTERALGGDGIAIPAAILAGWTFKLAVGSLPPTLRGSISAASVVVLGAIIFLPQILPVRSPSSAELRLRASAESGGTVDLEGTTVRLTAPLVVEGGASLVLCNGALVGPLRDGSAPCVRVRGKGTSLELRRLIIHKGWAEAESGARLTVRETTVHKGARGLVISGENSAAEVQHVTVYGSSGHSGVEVGGGGRAMMRHVTVAGSKTSGVHVHGKGSCVEMHGGGVCGSRELYGVYAAIGGKAVLKGVDIEDSEENGVYILGEGSSVELCGGKVHGSRKLYGVFVAAGGTSVLRGVDVADNEEIGVYVLGHGSSAEIDGGNVRGSKKDSGVSVASGARAVLRTVEVFDNKQMGIYAIGEDTVVEVQGGRVHGSREHGLYVSAGGKAVLRDVDVAENRQNGVHVIGQGSVAELHGGKVLGGTETVIGGALRLHWVDVDGQLTNESPGS